MAKLKWGMIGGGEGSQIGPAHRLGALAPGEARQVGDVQGEGCPEADHRGERRDEEGPELSRRLELAGLGQNGPEPEDAYAALGLGGQTVAVHPSSGVVLARLGPPGELGTNYAPVELQQLVDDALVDRD